MMLVAAGLMTGCGKDSEETPTKPEDPGDPIPPVTTTYEIGDYYENGFVKGIVIYILIRRVRVELWFRSMKLKPYGLTNTKNRWLLSHRRGDIIRIVYIIWKDGGRIIPGSCGAVKRMLWELKTGMCRIRES